MEVLRLYSGRMWLERAHFDRLRRSLDEMQFPPIDHVRLHRRIEQLIAESAIAEGTVYIQITRGVGASACTPSPIPPCRRRN